jgi:general secretion pathway protein G
MQARLNRGYTLIELLVVLAILALMASMTMPLAEMTVQRERERELKRALWEIRDAIDAYNRAFVSGAIAVAASATPYPPDLVSLTRAYPDSRPDRRGNVQRFLRRVPRDPFADPTMPAEQSWGLRSYLSEAERPRAGGDVYDVFSKSDRVGLNGVPLNQW